MYTEESVTVPQSSLAPCLLQMCFLSVTLPCFSLPSPLSLCEAPLTPLVLGHPWLGSHNPCINWRGNTAFGVGVHIVTNTVSDQQPHLSPLTFPYLQIHLIFLLFLLSIMI